MIISERGARSAVVATTPDDAHMWNLVFVQMKLEERGISVVNLGSCTPADLVAETVRDLSPDILVISSINGHGSLSLQQILDALDAYQVRRRTKIVVGGLLTTDPSAAPSTEAELLALGCAGVFTGEDAWQNFFKFLDNFDSAAGQLNQQDKCDTHSPADQTEVF